MLGYLLARAGVDVCVLEKHGDFLRDFRGDTIHPSTLEVMFELGIVDEFLKRPHQEAPQLKGRIGDTELMVADFAHVHTHCHFIALMPQWDFLNFIVEQARRYPTFQLEMNAGVTGVIEEGGRISGVRGTSSNKPFEMRAQLVVGADGRHSRVRDAAGLEVDDYGAPIDVVWFRISRHPDDPALPFGRIDQGKIMVLLDRADYWQCGFVIPKGAFEEIKQKGLEQFRAMIACLAPFLKDRVHELREWNDIKLLTVKVDRLRKWFRPGLLCIGDAAHAMSPVGGVGINLAIQDAVASANILAEPLRAGALTTDDLKKVQKRREFPARLTQSFQIAIQNRVIGRVLASTGKTKLPWQLKLVKHWAFLRRIPARLIGIGVRPENADTVVYFPNLKVVAVGDLLTPNPDPDYSAGGSLVGWGPVLTQILKLDFDGVVPSKGPAVSRAGLEAFKTKIDTLVSRATELVKKGVPKDELMAKLKTDDLGWKLSFTPDQVDGFYTELSQTKQPAVEARR
jgi:2-polyprenyl-6-methoxyphenol hydroxylase-like FAD-dependent oxidoreductase